MTVKRLREAFHAQPFRPFFLHLADGRALEIRHPEFLAFSPSGRTISVFQPDDSHNIVDILLVTDIEHKAPAKSRARKNGRKR